MGVYNYQKNGFSKQPVDYYYSPFDWTAIDAIGNNKDMNCNLCMGAREEYSSLLNYAEKFIHQMKINSKPYFGFFWEASLTHDYLNFPSLGNILTHTKYKYFFLDKVTFCYANNYHI